MDQAIIVPIGFFVMVVALALGVPLVRAFTRHLDGQNSSRALPSGIEDTLQQLQQSVDSVALEVERISEAQRFTTRLLADRGITGENGTGVAVHSSTAQSQPRRD